MTPDRLSYDPDGWAHDLHEWWAPLARLAGRADVACDDWRHVLGVDEFFDPGLLGQTQVLTAWLCLAAAAVAASAGAAWARAAGDGAPSDAAEAAVLAGGALEMAMDLQRLRWQGRRIGEGVISTRVLAGLGQAAMRARGFPSRIGGRSPAAVWLVAGWLAHAGGEPPAPLAKSSARPGRLAGLAARQAVAHAATATLSRRPGAGALDWAAAHLAERLAVGALDDPGPGRSAGGPASKLRLPPQASANVLLAAAHPERDPGQLARFEARWRRSLLALPLGVPIPDLARLAFLRADDEFVASVQDAFAAACRFPEAPRRAGLVSWSLHLPSAGYPLAERVIRGPSASLGAYVAFRALSDPSVTADDVVAFTGRALPDGTLSPVGGASGKIAAARDTRVRVVVHPAGQAWQDPSGTVSLVSAASAEDAVSTAAEQSRCLRTYLEAACRLIAPEPWLQAWLESAGPEGAHMPLLDVTARHLSRRVLAPAAGGPGHAGVLGQPPGGPAPRPSGPGYREPEVAPCPAHLLARTHPDYSFAISAGGGCGKTMAARRIVAGAARHALDALRAGPGYRPATVTIPLYLPLGEIPANWDQLVNASIDALPDLPASALEIGAALAAALSGGGPVACRALVVVDGTHRTRSDDNLERQKVGDFVALIAAGPVGRGPGWQPAKASQVVLCGRSESRRHQRAVEALRRVRPGWMATMGLDPLSDVEIDRFVSSLAGRPVPAGSRSRSLVSNPLLLALSVVAGQPEIDSDPVDVFDRGIGVLLGGKAEHRRGLAEIALRAATARQAPIGEFTLADIAAPQARDQVAEALADRDNVRAWATALSRQERDAFEHAEQETHLVTAAGRGWRFFHDRAFAFLVADRVARRATEEAGLADPESEDAVFGVLGAHLGDPLWVDAVEATGRLLELRSRPAGARAGRLRDPWRRESRRRDRAGAVTGRGP